MLGQQPASTLSVKDQQSLSRDEEFIQLRDKNLRLEERLNHFKSENYSLRRENQHLQQQIHSLKTSGVRNSIFLPGQATEILRAADKNVAQTHSSLAKRLAEVEQMEKTLNDKERKLGEQQAEMQELTADLISLRMESNAGDYTDDTQLVNEWQNLQYAISRMTETNYRLPAEVAVEKVRENIFHGMVSPSVAYQLAGRVLPCLIAAHIWRTLVFQVFGAKGQMWAGQSHKDLEVFRKRIEDYTIEGLISDEDYHHWVSRTAIMMRHISSDDKMSDLRVLDLARTLASQLSIFLRLGPHRKHDLTNSFQEIVRSAVDLAYKMARSRAAYIVFMYDARDTSSHPLDVAKFGMPFNPSFMESLGDSCPGMESEVALIISPGVYKVGNSRGTNYDETAVIIKTQVLALPRLSKKPEPQGGG